MKRPRSGLPLAIWREVMKMEAARAVGIHHAVTTQEEQPASVHPHLIEKILDRSVVQFFLRRLTRKKGDGHCLLADIFQAYQTARNSPLGKARYLPALLFIELLRKMASAQRDFLKQEVFGYPPRARALINTARSIGIYGLTRPQVFYAPLMVVWNFTQACNLKCKHCYQNAGKTLPDELTLREQLEVVEQLIDLDVAILALSGGEPLLSPNLLPVARKAHEGGMYVTIATNGTLLTKEMARKLVDHGVEYVEISLDSVYPAKHNAFRGIDCWTRVVKGIKDAVAVEGLKVGIATTMTRMNIDELKNLIAFAKDLGVKCFNAFNFIPTGRGKEIVDQDIAPEAREEMLMVLWRHLQEEKIEIMSTAPQLGRACLMYSLPQGVFATGHAGQGAGEGARTIAKYVGGCGAGRCYCAIQPNGVVTPCVYIPLPIGDLRKKKLIDIWQGSELLKLLRDRKLLADHCGICPYRNYCGGCRARAYGYFGDLTEADPGCIYNRRKWERLKEEQHENPFDPTRFRAGF
ncbi:MAG: radical SAM protein [Thermodesulfobacteriota bacterium]